MCLFILKFLNIFNSISLNIMLYQNMYDFLNLF